MEEVGFETNFMYEPDYSTSRGMLIYGENFIGTLTLKDLSMRNHSGIYIDFIQEDIS
jgi:hypothetical protein